MSGNELGLVGRLNYYGKVRTTASQVNVINRRKHLQRERRLLLFQLCRERRQLFHRKTWWRCDDNLTSNVCLEPLHSADEFCSLLRHFLRGGYELQYMTKLFNAGAQLNRDRTKFFASRISAQGSGGTGGCQLAPV